MNGRLVLEGSLRIYWGVQGVIHLKENDDTRTVAIRKRNSFRENSDFDSDDDINTINYDSSCNDVSSLSTDTSLDCDGDDVSLKSDITIESSRDSSSSYVSCSSSSSPTYGIPKSMTLPPKLDIKNMEWDELDELLQVERKIDDSEKLYQTMPVVLPSQASIDSTSSTISSNGSKHRESTP